MALLQALLIRGVFGSDDLCEVSIVDTRMDTANPSKQFLT